MCSFPGARDWLIIVLGNYLHTPEFVSSLYTIHMARSMYSLTVYHA